MNTMKAIRRSALALWCCCAGVAHAAVDIPVKLVPETQDAWAYLGFLDGSQVVRFMFEPTQQAFLNYSIIVETDAGGFSADSFSAGMTSVDGTAPMRYEGVIETGRAQYTFNGLLKGGAHTVALDFTNLAFSHHLTTVSIVANPLIYRVADFAATVPEPETGALLLLGLPLLAWRLRARRNSGMAPPPT